MPSIAETTIAIALSVVLVQVLVLVAVAVTVEQHCSVWSEARCRRA